MNSCNIIDESFNENLTSTCSLSMQLSYWGFTYSILDNYNNKYVALKHINFGEKLNDDSLRKKINEIIISDDILCKPYKQTKLVLNISKSTLVPEPLFDINNLKNLLTYNNNVSDTDEILYYKLTNTDIYVVYSIPSSIKQIFHEWFNEIKFYHQCCPFIQQNLIINKNNADKKKIYVDVYNDDTLNILVIESSNLLYYNSYNFTNEDDFIYYVMNIYNMMKLNPEEVEIIISGDIAKDDKYYKKMYDYIRHISFCKHIDNINFSYKFKDLLEHLHINLLNLIKCE